MNRNLSLLLYGVSILEGNDCNDKVKSLKRAILKAIKCHKNPPVTHEDEANNTKYLMDVLRLADELNEASTNKEMSSVLLSRAMTTVEEELKIK